MLDAAAAWWSAVAGLVFLITVAAGHGYDRKSLGDGPVEFQAVLRAGVGSAAVVALGSVAFAVPLPRVHVAGTVVLLTVGAAIGRHLLRRSLHGRRSRGVAMSRTLVVGDATSVHHLIHDLRSADLPRVPGHRCLPARRSRTSPRRTACPPSVRSPTSRRSPTTTRPTSSSCRAASCRATRCAGCRGRSDGPASTSWSPPGWSRCSVRACTCDPTAGLSLLRGGDDVAAPPPARQVDPRPHPRGGHPARGLAGDPRGGDRRPRDQPRPGVLPPAPHRRRRPRVHDVEAAQHVHRRRGASRRPPGQHSDRDGLMFKMHDDPRITSVGRLLRRYSVDELPQLLERRARRHVARRTAPAAAAGGRRVPRRRATAGCGCARA